ncbi:MAG: oligosaccharide flippase family protein [Flavobacteriales bacterium]|nr:oligosaccharide flippase family protein [Flavobacteriales bacterium]MCB9204381.1 oligosaccharide flippase family protein [Flavobacteriales bacterium]
MQRKFLSNLAFLLFLNLLVKPFWIFGIDRAVQNEVGAEAYGSYFALFNFAFILNVFLDLGISNFNNRNVSQHQHLLGKYFPRIIALRFLLAIGYFILCMIAAFVLDYSAAQMAMLSLLCFNQFLLSTILFLRSNIAGLQLFRIDSMISIMDRLLMILSCGWILYFMERSQPFQIEWFVYLQTFAYGSTALFALFFVLKKGGPFSMKWNPAMLLLILKQSLPFALLILLMSIYGRVDSVLLERLLPDGKEQTGIYAQAFRLLDASNMIAYLFAVLLLPMFSRMIKTLEDVRPLAEMASKLLLIPAATLGVICWYYGNDLMNLLYDSHVTESGKVLSLLMLSMIPMAGAYVFGTLLTANGSLKQLNIIALIGVACSIVLNIILIPKLGSYGAAITCLTTQLLAFSFQLIVAIKMFEFKPGLNTLFLIIPIGLVVLLGGSVSQLDWRLASLLVLSTGGILTLGSLIPDLKTLKSLKSK